MSDVPNLKCGKCGTTYEEFLHKGRFGCAQCYRSFRSQLGPALRGIQGAETHSGKRPKSHRETTETIVKKLSEADRLTLELQEAIEKEEFEEAARLRDRIKELKKEEIGNA